jgi:hypothetical protein
MADSIEEIERRRADRKATREAARNEQYAKDLLEVEALEVEHGDDRVSVLRTSSFVAELPTLLVVTTPAPVVTKRYRQMVRRAGQNYTAIGEARDMMAAECVGYPNVHTEEGKALYERMKQAWPGIHDDVAMAATKLAEAEGKD